MCVGGGGGRRGAEMKVEGGVLDYYHSFFRTPQGLHMPIHHVHNARKLLHARARTIPRNTYHSPLPPSTPPLWTEKRGGGVEAESGSK